jgi:hypothetical protein
MIGDISNIADTYLVHAMPWQCMFALFGALYNMISMAIEVYLSEQGKESTPATKSLLTENIRQG